TEPKVDEMNRKLFRYLNFYNFVRPHQGLGYKTPVEKFEEYIKKHQGVHHVLNENIMEQRTRLTLNLKRRL
ncbi:Integrase core domain-containing protein, partial [Balnearium lithotrophicum]